jgi:hypothetical protein
MKNNLALCWLTRLLGIRCCEYGCWDVAAG